jgi:hypothetical protein
MNNVYKRSYIQQGNSSNSMKINLLGYGLGGQFKRFFKWIIPLVSPAIAHVGNRALSAVGDIAKDVSVGKTIQEAAGTHINTAVADLKTDIEKKLRGGKRKRKTQKVHIKFSKQKHDIFS